MDNESIFYKTLIGTARITGNIDGIQSIIFIEEDIETSKSIPEFLRSCIIQLEEYFNGIRREFDLKLNPNGTDFQNSVWDELKRIPYGKTLSYMEQTKKLGNLKAIRAVASANGKNQISIVIPCHRVIGSDGSLTGYAGGLWRKKWLLELENPNRQTSLF